MPQLSFDLADGVATVTITNPPMATMDAGTLVELAVVWEMLNKSVIRGKPMVVLGDFWTPILDRVREVELGHPGTWGEASGKLVEVAATPGLAAEFLRSKLR